MFISNRLRIISVTHKFSQWQNNCQDGLLMKEEDRKKKSHVQAGECTFSNTSRATIDQDDRTWTAALKSKSISPLRYIYLIKTQNKISSNVNNKRFFYTIHQRKQIQKHKTSHWRWKKNQKQNPINRRHLHVVEFLALTSTSESLSNITREKSMPSPDPLMCAISDLFKVNWKKNKYKNFKL